MADKMKKLNPDSKKFKTEEEWDELSGYNLQKGEERIQSGAQRNIGPEMGVQQKYPGKMATGANKRKAEEIPSDIADQLQTDKNNRAYKAYEKRRAAGEDYKKGGCVKMAKGGSASRRADGCAQRGKTKGRIV